MIYRGPKSLAVAALMATLMISSTAVARSPFRIHKGKGIVTITSSEINNGTVTQTSRMIGTGTHVGKAVMDTINQTDLATGRGIGSFELAAADGSIARGTIQYQVLPSGVFFGTWQFTPGDGTKRFANIRGSGEFRAVPINPLQSQFSWIGVISY